MRKMLLSERLEAYTYYGIDGCWYWIGYVNKQGYGGINISGEAKRVHRITFTLAKGEIPRGMIVCHSCDNPSCINPDHLFLGTHQDNVDDMISKGRSKPPFGSQKSQAKFTEEQVIAIRNLQGKVRGSYLARQQGVSHATISLIWSRKNWKHV